MKGYISLATTDGFMFTDGKLRAYEFISALVDFESGMVEYTCKLGGTQTTFTTETCPVIYPSISAYKGVSSCKVKEVNWVETIRWVFGLYLSREYNQSGKKATLWRIENNTPIAVDAPFKGFLFTKDDRKYVGDDYEYFEQEDHARVFCDEIVVDSQGVESVEPSVAKRLELDAEQREVVEALQMALKRTKELGIGLVIDTDYENLYAYSNKQIAETEYDCGGSIFRDDKIDILPALRKEIGDSILCCSFSDFNCYARFK